MHERVYQLVVEQDEITWQTILFDLVKKGDLDPWNVDISLLADMYTSALKELQEMNLFISGKMILAAALLLRIKSEKLLTEDIAVLDNILFPPDDFGDDFMSTNQERLTLDVEPRLSVKTPQARKKKVSINDLIEALERAMTVNGRRILRREARDYVPTDLYIPPKPIDITQLIQEVYTQLESLFSSQPHVTFTDLLPHEPTRDVKYTTLVPLLYLATQTKICLDQDIPFGEITITKYTGQ